MVPWSPVILAEVVLPEAGGDTPIAIRSENGKCFIAIDAMSSRCPTMSSPLSSFPCTRSARGDTSAVAQSVDQQVDHAPTVDSFLVTAADR